MSKQRARAKSWWKLTLSALDIILGIASEKPRRLQYCPAKAQALYDEQSISGHEYAKCIHRK